LRRGGQGAWCACEEAEEECSVPTPPSLCHRQQEGSQSVACSRRCCLQLGWFTGPGRGAVDEGHGAFCCRSLVKEGWCLEEQRRPQQKQTRSGVGIAACVWAPWPATSTHLQCSHFFHTDRCTSLRKLFVCLQLGQAGRVKLTLLSDAKVQACSRSLVKEGWCLEEQRRP